MIDRQRRDQFAELLRHFAAGLITNDEYEIRMGVLFRGLSVIEHREVSHFRALRIEPLSAY